MFGGLRGQFGPLVIGGDLGYGRSDGDLHLDETDSQLTIDYANDSQWHWAIHAGRAPVRAGRRRGVPVLTISDSPDGPLAPALLQFAAAP